MLSFIARRLAATLVVLLVASFVVYQLTAISGDPLLELRASRDPNIQSRIDYLSGLLDLDVPPLLRYFYWLGGAAGCLVGQCDLGISIAKGEMAVTQALGGAMFSTLQLITQQQQQTLEKINATLENKLDALIRKMDENNSQSREALTKSLKDFGMDQRINFEDLTKEQKELRAQTADQLEKIKEKE